MIFTVSIIAFLSGIIAAHFFGWMAGFLLIIFLFLAMFLWRRLLFIVMIFFLLGVIRWQTEAAFFSVDNLAEFRDQKNTISFFATVMSDPEINRTHTGFMAESCVKMDFCGRIMVLGQRFPEVEYGDVLRLTGKLQSPRSPDNPNDFSYAHYLSVRKIYTVMNFPDMEKVRSAEPNFLGYLLTVKHYFLRQIERLFLEPESGLLAGLLLGVDSFLPKSVMANFRQAGLSHITAVSGYNINVVLLIVLQIFYFVHRKYRLGLAWFFLILYCGLVGLQASVVRAFVMGSLTLLASWFGRPKEAARLLLMAAILMVLYNPAYILFDIGWQLSFAATAGLIWLSPFLEKWLLKIPNWWGLRSSLVMTMAAQLATMPIILFYFKQMSWLSPLANLLVGPLIPWAMLFGFVSLIGSVVWFQAGLLIANIDWLWLFLITKIAEVISNFEF